jgi:hypothetical protein
MDALNGWLKAVRAEGLVLARTRVAGPWGFAVEPRDAVVFHFAAEGHAFVRQANAETFRESGNFRRHISPNRMLTVRPLSHP